MRVTLTMHDKERRELSLLLDCHEHCKKVDLELTNDNGIGTAIIFKCPDCDMERDITDYSTW